MRNEENEFFVVCSKFNLLAQLSTHFFFSRQQRTFKPHRNIPEGN